MNLHPDEYITDLLIVGGGMGGVGAALAISEMGFSAILTEETDWLGGQVSSQAVPPDEHRWIEHCGCTALYRRFRENIRDFYRRNYPLSASQRDNPLLNPGAGWVSRLCHEPRVAALVLEEMLASRVASGRLRVLKRVRAI